MSDRRKPTPEPDANYPVPLWWAMVAGMPVIYRRPKKAAARAQQRLQLAELRASLSAMHKAWFAAYQAQMEALLVAFPNAKIEECQSWTASDEG